MKWRGLICGTAVAGLVGFAAPAHAVNITGNLSISGAITYDTQDTAGGAILSFEDPFSSPPSNPNAPFVEVTSASGYLGGLGLGIGSSGTILNLSNIFPGTPTNTTYAPAGVDLTGTVNNFLDNWTKKPSLGGGAIAGLHFDLTSIPLQGGTGCPATPACAEGPFILVQTNNGVRIDFDVFGNFVNGADSGFYKGSFSMVVNGLSLAEAGDRLTNSGLDIMCGNGPGGILTGPQNLEKPCSFTANFDTATVPEPATLSLFGLGAVVLAASRRRMMKKAVN